MAEDAKPLNTTHTYKERSKHTATALAILCMEKRDDPRSLRLITAIRAARRAAGVAGDDYEGKLLTDAAPKWLEAGIPQARAEVVRRGQAGDLG